MEGKTVKTENIGGREPGDKTLVCTSCGHFWGKDDLDAKQGDDDPEVIGRCPICEGVVNEWKGEPDDGPEKEDVSV